MKKINSKVIFPKIKNLEELLVIFIIKEGNYTMFQIKKDYLHFDLNDLVNMT